MIKLFLTIFAILGLTAIVVLVITLIVLGISIIIEIVRDIKNDRY